MERRIVLITGICMFLASGLWAQGLMVGHWPPDHRHTLPRPIPPPDFHPHQMAVESIRFDARIENQVAKTRVVQVFRNDAPYTLEGTYFFPLPEGASVSDFVIYEGQRKIRGEILEKDRARQTYQSIVRQIRDPGLLEYAGLNLFKARIFPIPARGTKKIELEYSAILKADTGLVRYVYPLGTGGRALHSPIHLVSGQVRIASPVPIKNIYSPTHAMTIHRENDRAATASFEVTDQKPVADFQFYYSFSEQEFGMSLLTFRQPGEDGYFMLLLSPKTEIRNREISKKDIVFVMDVSGSMSARGKIVKARNALQFGIRSLNEGDRFNIISFATEETPFSPGLVAASQVNRERASRFVNEFRAAGGTNIYDALEVALEQFPESDRPHYLVLLTDGLPTVGEIDSNRILDQVRKLNRTHVRLFTFGVGYDVNTFLLDQLASSNRGNPDYVAPAEDMEVKVSTFFRKINSPVLSDLELEAGKIKLLERYPKRLPDVFKGTQVTLLGRYTRSGSTTMRLTGTSLNENRSYEYPDRLFPRESSDAGFLPRLWASRKVGYLLDQIRLHGESTELREEVTHLAKKYGFVTPYTSYLAADDSRIRPAWWERPYRPGQTPRGIAGGIIGSGGSGLRLSEAMAIESGDLKQQTGALAVHTSKAIEMMKRTTIYPLDSATKTEIVDGKTFFLQDASWIDASYDKIKHLPEVILKYGSDEYFDLLAEHPALGKFLALGERLTVVFNKKVYKISP